MRFVHCADDTTVFQTDSDINNAHASMNRELVRVDNWLNTNRLSLLVKLHKLYDNLQPEKRIGH